LTRSADLCSSLAHFSHRGPCRPQTQPSRPPPRPRPPPHRLRQATRHHAPHQSSPFSASDLALILARITRGLLRAEALEARVIRDTARLDAEPAPPRAPSHRRSPPARATDAAGEALVPGLGPGICLPTPEQIAAEVRRRPIGAVIADICRDLGIMPSHPLWPELQQLIIRYGGNLANLVKGILDRAFPYPAASGPPAWPAVSLQSADPSSTGPPP
jgi:hypothetical protein